MTISLRDLYNDYAPTYVATVTPLARYYERVGAFLALHATGTKTVLDLGCGPGHLTAALPPAVEVLGLDLSPQMIEVAQRARPSGRYQIHDLHAALPVEPGSIDVLLCAGVLDFCFMLGPVVAEIARVLRPGARAFVTFADRLPHEPARRPLSPNMPASLQMALYSRKELRRAFGQRGLQRCASDRGPGYYHRGYQRDIIYSFWDLQRA